MHASPGGDRGLSQPVDARSKAESGGVTRAPRESVRWHALALAVSLVVPGLARADEPWLLDLEASGGAPLSQPQSDWYGGGGSLAIGVARPLAPWIALQARLRTALFLDGDRPTNANTDDPGSASLNSLTVGLTVRLPDRDDRRATGLWGGFAAGPGVTGKDVRAMLEASLGYGFGIGRSIALGPVVHYLHVVQPNSDVISASDARIILVGARLSLFDSLGAPPPPPPPEPTDRDGDGVFDDADKCPDNAEDKDGFQDEDGCPEDDNDQDGILDPNDRCPDVAEDKDNFADTDGCVDPDNDNDGILDANDQCPNEPETLNGERDDDGCPDQGLIVMRDDRVVLEERVLFDLNSPKIKKGGEPVLRAIVKLHSQHPEWTKVRVEGHADARGEADFNQKLSQQRAENVRESLVKLGLPGDAVTAEGFGATRLLSTGTSEDDHRTNRRVEFVVISRQPAAEGAGSSGAVPAPAQPAAPKGQ